MAKSKTSKGKTEEMRACSCCSVRFRPDLCPQCYVAGCAHKGKGKSCLLNSSAGSAQGMSEFQVREAYRKLLAEHQQLLQSIPKPNGRESVTHVRRNPSSPVKVTTRVIEGELHG